MKVPLFKTYQDEDDISAVANVIRRGSYWADGPEIMEFENRICEYCGSESAVVFNSGTSALQCILEAIGVKEKDVIVPSFTFVSTASSVKIAGGIPVFADIETESLGLDANDVIRKITQNTAAVIIVHYGGLVARDIEKISEICKKHDIALIEDAAESIGAKLNNRMAGTFGICGMYSFCQNKIISTGEGGAAVTRDKELYQKLKLLVSHGRLNSEYFYSNKKEEYTIIGYNYRMPSMNAALGISQLGKIDKLIHMRKEIAETYNKKLSKIPGIRIIMPKKESEPVYQMYSILLPSKRIRDGLMSHLHKNGIMSKIYFKPVHEMMVFRLAIRLDVTERMSSTILSLPIFPEIKEQNYVINKVKEYMENERIL